MRFSFLTILAALAASVSGACEEQYAYCTKNSDCCTGFICMTFGDLVSVRDLLFHPT
jgi:hypothetical protein